MFKLFQILRRRRPQTYKPVILVTGAASGIGRAIAGLLYPLSEYRVAITAREKSVAELKSRFPETDRFLIRALDVTVEGERRRVVDELTDLWGGVDILVNNAGISYRAVVEHMTDADEILQMSTNYFGPVGLIRAVLPNMREKGRGKIINISSVSGMLAMPTMASYSASKYALEGMSEALWYETKPLGIDVSLIQPGFIRSKSFKNVYYTAKSKPEAAAGGPYTDYYQNMSPFIEKLMHRSFSNPSKVAKLVLKIIRRENPPLWIPGTPDALFFYYIRRVLPRRLLLPFLFFALPGARRWGKSYTNKRK
jgi:NAD(P)-dependent dehydrogenase (short-subunit alcohol dehydrogenase family)